MKPTILSFYRLIENFDGTKEKLDEINQLLDEHPRFINFTGNNQPLLHFACQVKKPEIARLLIEKGADVNYEYQGDTPLMIAFQNEQDQLCCLLIENKANPETKIKKNYSILFLAYKQNKMNIFKTLLKYGANPDVYFEEKIAIYKAYTDKKENAFALLLENGANPEITCEDGKTILLNSFFKYLKKGEDDYFKRILNY